MSRLPLPVALLLACALLLAACGDGGDGESSATPDATEAPATDVNQGCEKVSAAEPKDVEVEKPKGELDPDKTYVARVLTNCGEFEITLDAKRAPKTGGAFKALVDERFYDGLAFHRIVPGFVIQGGDPKGDGSGGPGYQITDEVPANGYAVGSVAYAKAGDEPAGTAGSQFFIVTSPAPAPGQGLDALNQQPYQYGALGTVTEGLDVAQKIGALAPASGDGEPTKPVKVKSIRITESGGESTTTAPAATTAPPG
jgi:peptidyl-prolyl cis-trans isomerase B (cyclophilin B)